MANEVVQQKILNILQSKDLAAKSANVFSLIESQDISAQEALAAYPEDKELIKFIYDWLKSNTIDSQAILLEQLMQGKVNPIEVIKRYPENEELVRAAYQVSKESILYADRELINRLGIQGLITREDISEKVVSEEEKRAHEQRFTKAFDEGDWQTVAQICNLFWFEKPIKANYEWIINELKSQGRWQDIYNFEYYFKPQVYETTYGPIEKTKETIELESLMRKLMLTGDFRVESRADGDYFVFADEEFNWTKIRSGSNLQHIDLTTEDFEAYQTFMANNLRNPSSLLPENEYKYREELYKYYYKHGIPRPDPPISFSEMQAINIYTGGNYEQMNGLMRDEVKKFDYRKSTTNDIRSTLIQSVMCSSGLRKLPETDIQVAYRWASLGTEQEQLERVQAAAKHGVVELKGFVSATIDDSLNVPNKPIVYTFHNLRGAYVAPISKFEEELEFLIPQTQVQINSYKYFRGKHYIDATIVDDLAKRNISQFSPYCELSPLADANPGVILSLLRENKFHAEDAVQIFPNDEAIVLEAYQKVPVSIAYASKASVMALFKSGQISGLDVIKFFKYDSDIVNECIKHDPNIINFLDKNILLFLVKQGFIPGEMFKQNAIYRYNLEFFPISKNKEYWQRILEDPSTDKEVVKMIIRKLDSNNEDLLGIIIQNNNSLKIYEAILNEYSGLSSQYLKLILDRMIELSESLDKKELIKILPLLIQGLKNTGLDIDDIQYSMILSWVHKNDLKYEYLINKCENSLRLKEFLSTCGFMYSFEYNQLISKFSNTEDLMLLLNHVPPECMPNIFNKPNFLASIDMQSLTEIQKEALKEYYDDYQDQIPKSDILLALEQKILVRDLFAESEKFKFDLDIHQPCRETCEYWKNIFSQEYPISSKMLLRLLEANKLNTENPQEFLKLVLTKYCEKHVLDKVLAYESLSEDVCKALSPKIYDSEQYNKFLEKVMTLYRGEVSDDLYAKFFNQNFKIPPGVLEYFLDKCNTVEKLKVLMDKNVSLTMSQIQALYTKIHSHQSRELNDYIDKILVSNFSSEHKILWIFARQNPRDLQSLNQLITVKSYEELSRLVPHINTFVASSDPLHQSFEMLIAKSEKLHRKGDIDGAKSLLIIYMQLCHQKKSNALNLETFRSIIQPHKETIEKIQGLRQMFNEGIRQLNATLQPRGLTQMSLFKPSSQKIIEEIEQELTKPPKPRQ